ncbi:TPA: hypothetical protein N2940_000264 [Vibrio parahaemolyticus]|uniref:HEPN domain-containing protein n=1 Tax=Vibrio parahaemolyticus TaxID=670 RepID=UPI0009433A0D|nr:HEPN domain-containing protein [Vibrio parahaemolyticus]MBE3890066.1 hypothetical protein [Vibrio parahaemolyticus]MBE3937913.1 hypothetical protein [Vibrio parahaemolyticus]MDG2676105.1 HEPN domain-containing protein [Vibrio parahaemolyticus]OKY30703.1 hypothetical protein BTU71_12565 [Vibrio parahaemolyticus]TOD75440.1 hypothetical protein CGJ57_16085 [Vibrio parahaemolyticus]
MNKTKNYNELKQRQRNERSDYSPNLGIRVHRALSWLNKAEQCTDDDSKFTFLWIAFNSAYAQEFEQKLVYGEKGLYQEFLDKLVSVDATNKLHNIVWSEYAGTIRLILENEFILQSYWDFQSERISEQDWKNHGSKAKTAASKALGQCNTAVVLSILFSRLYTLRNQIIHGGATFNSSANRKQLRDCTSILEMLIPNIIELMMDNKSVLWGAPVYPLIQS